MHCFFDAIGNYTLLAIFAMGYLDSTQEVPIFIPKLVAPFLVPTQPFLKNFYNLSLLRAYMPSASIHFFQYIRLFGINIQSTFILLAI
ncbi:MAG TPA: hypothetical protein VIH61_03660 [Waddliaceae bacterium]